MTLRVPWSCAGKVGGTQEAVRFTFPSGAPTGGTIAKTFQNAWRLVLPSRKQPASPVQRANPVHFIKRDSGPLKQLRPLELLSTAALGPLDLLQIFGLISPPSPATCCKSWTDSAPSPATHHSSGTPICLAQLRY